MATNSEEVKIKLGVDGSAVGNGLTSVQNLVTRFSSNVTKSLGNILKVNLASMFGGNMIDIWDKGTKKLGEFIFKVSELTKTGQQLERTLQFWRNLRQEIEATEAAEMANRKATADASTEANLKLAQIEGLRGGKSRLENLKAEQKILEERLELSRTMAGYGLSAKESLDLTLKLEQNKSEQLKIQTVEMESQQRMQAESIAVGRRAMTELRTNVAFAQGVLGGQLRNLSDVSLGEAQSLVGLQDVPGLRFNRRQMQDIQRAQLLQRQAQQARIDGDESRADSLSRERLDLLKRNPWLAETDRNPLKIAEEQLDVAKQTLDLALNNGLAVKIKVVKK